MRQFDIDKFLNDLKNVPWSTAYIYDDVDDLWHHWAKLYNEVLDKHAPIKKKRVRGDQLPWKFRVVIDCLKGTSTLTTE